MEMAGEISRSSSESCEGRCGDSRGEGDFRENIQIVIPVHKAGTLKSQARMCMPGILPIRCIIIYSLTTCCTCSHSCTHSSSTHHNSYRSHNRPIASKILCKSSILQYSQLSHDLPMIFPQSLPMMILPVVIFSLGKPWEALEMPS